MGIVKYDREDRKKSPWGVKWSESGERRFKFFETKTERNEFFDKLKKKKAAEGSAILRLSGSEAAVLEECVKRAGSALNVLRAVEAFGFGDGTRQDSPVLAEAAKAFLDERLNAGLDDDYLRNLKKRIERFVEDAPGEPGAVDRAQAVAWIGGLNFAPRTVRSYLKSLRAFFGWMVQAGYVESNPFSTVPMPKVVEKEPEFLAVADFEALLRKAQEKCPDAVAYFVLGGFAGVRTSAAVALDRSHIRFETRGLLITGENSKTDRRQFVDGHEPNLWAWLKWCKKHAPDGFELPKRKWETLRTFVRTEAKVKMPANALRHSFCTYHCALYGDAGRTATLLTHRGSPSVMYDHYKGNATKGQAEAFFKIMP